MLKAIGEHDLNCTVTIDQLEYSTTPNLNDCGKKLNFMKNILIFVTQ